MNQLHSRLQYHVTGAIERGESEAIVERPVRLLSTIPFQGFYGSCHDAAIDYTEESLFQDSNGDSIPALAEHFYSGDSIDYSRVHESYSKDYVEALADHSKLELIFDELKCPREYNFETDRIFVTIPLRQVEALLAKVDKNALRKAIHDKFTSRPGFHSFYKNTLEAWPPFIGDWDHNQVGTLLEVAIQDWNELSYAEELSGSGSLYDILYPALTAYGQRLARIASYLRARQDR